MSNTKNSKFFDKEMPIGKHGILFEKYTSLATDAFRAQALELCGYKNTGNGDLLIWSILLKIS